MTATAIRAHVHGTQYGVVLTYWNRDRFSAAFHIYDVDLKSHRTALIESHENSTERGAIDQFNRWVAQNSEPRDQSFIHAPWCTARGAQG